MESALYVPRRHLRVYGLYVGGSIEVIEIISFGAYMLHYILFDWGGNSHGLCTLGFSMANRYFCIILQR